MNKMISWMGCAVLACTQIVLAGESSEEKRIKELEQALDDQGVYVEASQKGIKLSGYVDTSYTYNTKGGGTSNNIGGRTGNYAATANAGGGVGTFNNGMGGDSNDFNLNAVKLALEKALPEENKLAAGFRVDLLMGEDWDQIGSGERGIFVQQAYATFRIPVGNGLDVTLGKMASLLGFEADERPANMNFSYGTVYAYGLGLGYDTGLGLSYRFNDLVEAQLRIANSSGAASLFDSGFVGDSDLSKTFSAAVSLTPDEKKSLTFAVQYAGDGNFGSSTQDGHSLFFGGNNPTYGAAEGQTVVLDLNGKWSVTDKLTLAFDSAAGFQSNNRINNGRVTGAGDVPSRNGAQWVGFDLYAKYQFTDLFSLAGRIGYLVDQDGTAKLSDALGNQAQDDAGNFYHANSSSSQVASYTLTAGFNIWENVVSRLEYRLDWLSAGASRIDDVGSVLGVRTSQDNAFGSTRNLSHSIALNVAYEF